MQQLNLCPSWKDKAHKKGTAHFIFPFRWNSTKRTRNLSPFYSIYFQDLQSEIESHRVVYDRLDNTGRKLLGSLTSQEDAVMLQRRLDEMNQRWNHLKAKSIAIRWVLDAPLTKRFSFNFFGARIFHKIHSIYATIFHHSFPSLMFYAK